LIWIAGRYAYRSIAVAINQPFSGLGQISLPGLLLGAHQRNTADTVDAAGLAARMIHLNYGQITGQRQTFQ
jgi:hypothetical protein